MRVVWGGCPTLGVPSHMGSDGRPHVQTYTPKEQLYRADGETRVFLEVTVTTKNAIQEMAGLLRLSTSEFLEAVVVRLPADSWMHLMRAVRDRVEEDFPSVMIERQGCAGREVIQAEHEGQQVAARDIGSERLSEPAALAVYNVRADAKRLKPQKSTAPLPCSEVPCHGAAFSGRPSRVGAPPSGSSSSPARQLRRQPDPARVGKSRARRRRPKGRRLEPQPPPSSARAARRGPSGAGEPLDGGGPRRASGVGATCRGSDNGVLC